MQKVETHLINQGPSIAFSSTDLRHIFGSNVGNEFGVMLRGRAPHKPEIAFDIVHIPYLMMNRPD